jgi:phosphoribosylaminoimidazole-succinocarboxamide synthase
MMLGAHAEVLPVECVVRGYISGSGWKEYLASGAVCGIRFPDGMRESDRLPSPIFTPAWKAPAGQHDENITFHRVQSLIGEEIAEQVRTISLALYHRGAALCEGVGIILADTKFEFGLLPSGELLLIDEVMTPDSSRFWDAAAYEPGRAQASYDKQFVRDWLEQQPWDKTAPGPELPDDVVAGTRARYVEAFERITGASFARYLMEDVIAR